MFNGYKSLKKGLVNGDYVFSKVEAMSVLLAKRKDVFELGFLVRAADDGENFIKFVADDELVPASKVEIMERPKDSFEHAARIMKFDMLMNNPTPTLRQMRQVNQRIMKIQTKNTNFSQEK